MLKRAIAREVYQLIITPPDPVDTADLRASSEERGLTLAQAAHGTGRSIAALSCMERGRSSNRDAITTYQAHLDSLSPAP